MLDYFDSVFIVNLAHRTDRRNEVRQQLRNAGHDFGERIQLFPAVQPSAPLGFRSIGARGCFLSHLGCLGKAVEKSAGSVLILEDDVDFSPDYYRLQSVVAQRLALNDWDMFYGGGNIPADALLPDPSSSTAVVREVPHQVPIGLTHFVAVRGDSIEQLHAYLSAMLLRPAGHPEGGPMDVDGAYSWFRRQNQSRTLFATPELAHQRASASNITPRWFDQVPGFAIAARALRVLRRRPS